MSRLWPVLAIVVSTPARADTPVDKPAAIDVDRWTATATGWWAGLDDARVVGLGHLAVGVTTSVITRPIALTSSSGADLGAPVDTRATVSLAAAYGATETVELSVVVPVVLQAGDRLTAVGHPQALRRATTGDVRVGGKLQLVAGQRLDVAVAAGVFLPTGNEQHYAGDEGWTADIHGMAAYHRGALSLAAGAGVRIRSKEVALTPVQVVGNELAGALAISYRLPPIAGVYCDWTQLRMIAELDGVLGDDVGDKRGPSPIELRAGVRGRIWRGWTVGATIGHGLNDEIGAPRLRAVIDVAWTDAPRGEAHPPAPIEEPLDDCSDGDC